MRNLDDATLGIFLDTLTECNIRGRSFDERILASRILVQYLDIVSTDEFGDELNHLALEFRSAWQARERSNPLNAHALEVSWESIYEKLSLYCAFTRSINGDIRKSRFRKDFSPGLLPTASSLAASSQASRFTDSHGGGPTNSYTTNMALYCFATFTCTEEVRLATALNIAATELTRFIRNSKMDETIDLDIIQILEIDEHISSQIFTAWEGYLEDAHSGAPHSESCPRLLGRGHDALLAYRANFPWMNLPF